MTPLYTDKQIFSDKIITSFVVSLNIMVFTLFVFAAFWLIFLVAKHHVGMRNFPPGPPRYPVLGCLPALRDLRGSNVMMESSKWVGEYGSVIGLAVGRARTVTVQDFALAKRLASDDRLSGRLVSDYFYRVRGYGANIGIFSTEGETWRAHRRFALSTLKEFGFGKKSMEGIIAEEAKEAIDILVAESSNGKDFEVNQTFNTAIFNILWRIVAGKRYEHDDPHIRKMQATLGEIFKYAYNDRPFPLLARFFPKAFQGPLKQLHAGYMKGLFEETVEEHRRNFDPEAPPKDFIDVYLREMDQSASGVFNREQLIGTCMDFFSAGGETVGSTLSWAIMYLALNPEVQERCRREIDAKIGERSPNLEDRSELPFVEAAVMETQRFACVALAGLGHKAMLDVEIGGYHVPKDTLVYYNIYHFHHDPSYWEDPESFRPERFLEEDANGQMRVRRPDRFIPFGFGNRVCMGVTLAKAELFLFFVMIVQHLSIDLPREHPIPSPDDAVPSATRQPTPFFVRLQPRM